MIEFACCETLENNAAEARQAVGAGKALCNDLGSENSNVGKLCVGQKVEVLKLLLFDFFYSSVLSVISYMTSRA